MFGSCRAPEPQMALGGTSGVPGRCFWGPGGCGQSPRGAGGCGSPRGGGWAARAGPCELCRGHGGIGGGTPVWGSPGRAAASLSGSPETGEPQKGKAGSPRGGDPWHCRDPGGGCWGWRGGTAGKGVRGSRGRHWLLPASAQVLPPGGSSFLGTARMSPGTPRHSLL